jgi:prolyl oligopeptidase
MTMPPPTRRQDLVEQLHGHQVADPYRWLEAASSDPELAAWVRAQADAAAAHLDTLPARAWFRERLGELWNHPRRSAPWRRGDRWFQLANDGTQEQDVLWTAAAVADAPRATVPAAEDWTVLLDPASWTEDNTAALTGLAVTDDGRRAAFARSDAGSDWMVWRVVDTTTGRILADEVPWSKFSGAAWLADGRGFLYGAYDPPAGPDTHIAANRDQQLRLHVIGTDHADDPLIHARPDQPEWGFHPAISHDGAWLILTVTHGTHPTTRVHLAPIGADGIGEVRPLLDEGDARYTPLGILDDELIVVTDQDAPLGRVVAIDLHDGTRSRELIAAGDDRLQDARIIGGATATDPAWIVTHSLHHATSRLQVYDGRRGTRNGEVTLPGPGTVTAVSGGRHDTAAHLTFESFTGPAAVLRIDLDGSDGADDGVAPAEADGTAEAPAAEGVPSTVVTPPSAPIADHLVVEQVRVHHDGVAVPLFLIHRRDVAPDGAAPTVLWGYGGFDIAVTPMYRPGWRAWVDAGGLLAVACLRGGGEYGRAWHDDGRLARKEHVFDDALACAAWLTGRRRDQVTATPVTDGTSGDVVWSAPEHLGIEGRSNGGLLAAACLTREPDAFGSVVPEVGVLDMARFHRFTIGWAWTSDYGSPDDPDDLEVLLRYSPYHRIQPGRSYPPTLITTGDTDDRVVPAHSYKFAAALQHGQGGDAPVLLRVDIAAGHGAGKPVSKLLDERADVLAFHARHLGLPVRDDAVGDGGRTAPS